MENNILEVKNLKMHYVSKYETVKAINDISFSVKKGETFGLVGESGCGKSSVCKTLLQLLPPNAKFMGGSIKYKGKELIGLSNKELQKIRGREISMSFQELMTALNPVTKVKEQIYEQFIGLKMTKQEKYAKAVNLLKLVGIPSPEQRLEEYVHQFSGGMRQRIMIAIALAAQPSMLLADEPTTALDVTIQDQIIKLINSLKETLGMSIILVTHDLGVVSQMCDSIAVMYAGSIVETGDTLTIFSKPRHPYTEGLIRSMPKDDGSKDRLESIEGAPPNLNNLPKGCSFAERCKYATEICINQMPPLKEVGENHYSKCFHTDLLINSKGLIEL
ncbi:MAG: ABC transporter ATP-binding protein [Clostridia bacterium]|jgi:oligopeptide/dipeptide ABC transporter ATP-binding protein|nr:ABC transporter ATP-binding protein [Clostridia bacterium]MCI2000528.1 ABC transporter ATP-binding protein [Clostridia bacterium]MCI2014983.1 ABC transporter ATP-binding protein [Clostridia bacterium]